MLSNKFYFKKCKIGYHSIIVLKRNFCQRASQVFYSIVFLNDFWCFYPLYDNNFTLLLFLSS